MTKILNLDKLATQSTRELVIDGVKHPIQSMSVANFIQTTAQIEAMAKGAPSLSEQLDATADMIIRLVPSLPREALLGRSLQEMDMIATFVRGEDVEGQEVSEAEAGESGK